MQYFVSYLIADRSSEFALLSIDFIIIRSTTINTTVFIYSGKKENEVSMCVRVNLRRSL